MAEDKDEPLFDTPLVDPRKHTKYGINQTLKDAP